MQLRGFTAFLASVALFTVACSDDDPASTGGGGGGDEGGGGGGGGGVVLPELEEGWTEFKPGGDTLCARGGEYAYWVRKGKTNKLIVDFIGGGACWDRLTCSAASAIFSQDVENIREAIESDDPSGIYDDANPENPFADYYHVIVPYCTGDIHWGNNDTTYGEGANAFTIHHRGAVNARAVLDWVYENFSAPEEILVTGCSAGSYGSALWSAHIMEHYQDAKIFQLGDSGAGIVTQTFFEDSFPSWNAEGAFPTWIPALDPDRVNILEMALPDLYVGIANHYPAHRMSQYNTILDDNQVFYFEAMGGSGPEEWSELMLASIEDIEARADNFASFIAPGEKHCVVPYDNFYTVNADGTTLLAWIDQHLVGGDVESVKCQGAECDAPTP